MTMGPTTEAAAAGIKLWKFTGGIICLLIPCGLFMIEKRLFTEWKRVIIAGLLVLLGLSFYIGYMPFSSEQNPPMNWGYPRTTEGLKHAIGRGQYEKINPFKNFQEIMQDSSKFFTIVWKYMLDPGGYDLIDVRRQITKVTGWESIGDAGGYNSIVAQFKWYISWLAIVPFCFIARIGFKGMGWLVVTFIAFFFLTIIFIVFQYLDPDVQSLFIGRVQWIQAHAIFSMWIMLRSTTAREIRLLSGSRM